MNRFCFLLPALLVLPAALFAQVGELPPSSRDEPRRVEEKTVYKGSAILLHVGFGLQAPGGDMAKRFGNNGLLGGGVEHMSASNWILGAEGHYFFGSEVKEDPLAILRMPDGAIIGMDRLAATVILRERGWYAGGLVGRLFPVLPQKRAGIRATLSAGWAQHKIRVQDDSRTVNQLMGDYTKGYDRLSGGFALNQFIGWQQLPVSTSWNFMIGLEFNQAFTNTLREWDFNDRTKLDDTRLDLRFGIRANWTLPFPLRPSGTIYY